MVKVKYDMEKLCEIMDSDDLLYKEFSLSGRPAAIMYLDALTNKESLETSVLRRLLEETDNIGEVTAQSISDVVSYAEVVHEKTELDEVAQSISEGDVCLFAEGAEHYYIISMRKFEQRAVIEPPSSGVLRGPREGFIENMKVNVTLIRRKIKSPALKTKFFTVGRYSNTSVAVMYVDGIADGHIVAKVIERISAIDIDGIIDSSYIEAYLSERKHNIFDEVGSAEKPDIIAARILEGRVAVVVDGSPFVITVPFIFIEHFQDSYDYYCKDLRATILRGFRFLGAFFTIILPALYVAMQEYQYHALPIKFLITIQNSISGIPFPPPLEMIVVLSLFEVLHQASIRMPKGIGVTLSIVGAIVLGETGINSGIISSPTVLIVALSAIGINCVPEQIGAFSILRIANLLVASVLGIMGMVVFGLIVIDYMVCLESYGVPYMSPLAPIIVPDMKDAVIKNSLLDMQKRPYSIPTANRTRAGKRK